MMSILDEVSEVGWAGTWPGFRYICS